MVWPVDLFVSEARSLLARADDSPEGLGWVMAEAFHGELGWQLFEQVRARSSLPAGWGVVPAQLSQRTALVSQLVSTAATLPVYVPPRLYSQRLGKAAGAPLSKEQTLRSFARLVHQFAGSGYFAGAYGRYCVDDDDDPDPDPDPDAEAQRQLALTIDTHLQVWPGVHESQIEMHQSLKNWAGSRNLFYSLIEALHLVVARPRQRTWHDHGRQWDYADFKRPPGQRLYRWKVNQLLELADPGDFDVRLAEDGEDRGQLVHITGDPRDELVVSVSVPSADAVSERSHAVALFRGRGAGVPEKRSAILVLSRLLEHRRRRMKSLGLHAKDSGPLFDIANNFDLRHKDGKQYEGYSPAFLDWIFWWYLATLELTDRLIAEQDSA